jgi:homoserine/homoserine lactone efflux protein
MVIKWLGVAYLVWLGLKQWRAPATPLVARTNESAVVSRRRLVMRGWAVDAVNPKGTVFLLAVVPQFLDLQQALAPQYALIGATLCFVDLIVMAGYTALASRVLRLLRTPRQMRLLNRVFGSLFIGVGLLLAGFKRH